MVKRVFVVLGVVFVVFLLIGSNVYAFDEQRKFIGQEFDSGTGLNYLNARYYNAAIGKFTSQDPIFWNFDQAWLADPQNQNSYAYARNNPIVGSDPSGLKAELGIKPLSPIPGAHGTIIINAESGADLSKYGEGSRFTIGGYPSNGMGGKLQAQINEPGDLNFPESKYLAIYPLNPPVGVSVTQYDQKLLESGSNLASQDLGSYTFTGRPIWDNANSGNTAAQVVINAGGTFPTIKNVYVGPSYFPGLLKNIPYAYFPLGLGNPIDTPSYRQQAVTMVNNAVNSVKSAVTSSIFSALNVIKSKLHK